MSGFLDINVLVRYLTGDPPELSEKVTQIIDGEHELHVTDVVLEETGCVLMSVYRVPRDVVVDQLLAFMQKRNISPFGLGKDVVLQALLLCRPSGRESFSDAMIWAAARSSRNKVVYSLGARYPELGIEVRQNGS